LNLEGFIILIVFGAVISLILSNALSAVASEVSAQLVQNTNTSSSLQPSVKISSPVKGQQVPIGTPLTIRGTSTDDPVGNCQVSVILNGIKPYQKTIATGQSGSEVGSANDYSTWKYRFTPGYAVIKQGINKITSKISCSPQSNNPISLSKWYSVTVTGVANTRMEQLVQPTLPSKTIITAAMAPPTTANQKVSGTTSSTPSIPLNALYNNNNNNNYNNTPKILALSLDVSKDPIKRGSKETVITEVYDATSKEKITGAKIVGKVTSMSGGAVKESFEGISDKDGKESYSWKIAENGKVTKYKVTVQASAIGYQDVTSSTVFKVKPASTTTTSNNDHNSNDAGSSSHGNRNRQKNDNSFEETTIHSSRNHNRNTNDQNNDNNNNDNSFEVSTESSSHEEHENIGNNNDFGESMAHNINDFTHEIINGVNDMVKIHIR
jgi:hypothetical protein